MTEFDFSGRGTDYHKFCYAIGDDCYVDKKRQFGILTALRWWLQKYASDVTKNPPGGTGGMIIP
jgi:hypothetical protein